MALGLLVGCSVYGPSLISEADDSQGGRGGTAAQGGRNAASASGTPTAAGDRPMGEAGTSTAGREAGGATSPSGTGGTLSGAGASSAGTSPGGSSGRSNTGAGGTGNSGAAGSGSSGGGAGSGANGGSVGGTSGGAAGGGSSGSSGMHERATGRPATASTQEAANPVASGNDGNVGTRWCAINDKLPQWWRVDLGATYELTSFTVRFQFDAPTYSYVIETSQNDAIYTQRATVSGSGALQRADFPAGTTGRYVRLTVTSATDVVIKGASYRTWASFWEFTVTGP